jgi:hypothetical protein
MVWKIALVMVIALSTAGCSGKSVLKPAALFPESNEVPGWSKTGEPRAFDPGNLWEYINGDAEKYIQAGVEKTLTADYRYQDETDAVVDVYIMRAPEGARKVFEAESSLGSQAVELGDAGRLYRASLTFRQGSYFVRLVAYGESPEVEKALVQLGRAIERKLRKQKMK